MPGAAGCLRLGLLTPLSARQSGPFPPKPHVPKCMWVSSSTRSPSLCDRAHSFTSVCVLWGQEGPPGKPSAPCEQGDPFWGGQRAETAPSPRFLRCGAEGPNPYLMWCLLGWRRVCGSPAEGPVAPQNMHGGDGAMFLPCPPPQRVGLCVRRPLLIPLGGHSLTAPT